uniref:Uncharacterized protein n=1 Tax=Haptolina brevifila TaxID=156173 RepID=A0A7S2N7B2_9EUKA|mmetsp:Transcript_68542/g.135787  ORF Transcript_68542/g.135787 Transcript_68542/m.135787 type:complete len:110 (+) Transcript_68542:315-644(+)
MVQVWEPHDASLWRPSNNTAFDYLPAVEFVRGDAVEDAKAAGPPTPVVSCDPARQLVMPRCRGPAGGRFSSQWPECPTACRETFAASIAMEGKSMQSPHAIYPSLQNAS